jgi:hypothetical protein
MFRNLPLQYTTVLISLKPNFGEHGDFIGKSGKKNEITNLAELDKSLIAGIIYANPAKPEDARDFFRQPQRGRDIFFLLLYNVVIDICDRYYCINRNTVAGGE